MAKRPATMSAAADANEVPPAMDYAAHNATFHGFINLLKWTILALGVIAISLYFFIEAHQPLVGAILLLALPIGAGVVVVMGSRRT